MAKKLVRFCECRLPYIHNQLNHRLAFQYFVFLGGTEGESHLLTGPPPVVVVVEEKAVAR